MLGAGGRSSTRKQRDNRPSLTCQKYVSPPFVDKRSRSFPGTLRSNMGLFKHGDPVFPHFCPLNQNLARVRTRGDLKSASNFGHL